MRRQAIIENFRRRNSVFGPLENAGIIDAVCKVHSVDANFKADWPDPSGKWLSEYLLNLDRAANGRGQLLGTTVVPNNTNLQFDSHHLKWNILTLFQKHFTTQRINIYI